VKSEAGYAKQRQIARENREETANQDKERKKGSEVVKEERDEINLRVLVVKAIA
jgi:hypothetical protein